MYDTTAARRRKSGHWLIGAVLSLSPLGCAEHGGEAVTQLVASALTTTTYEAETLARTASAVGSKVTTETGASAGQYVQFTGTPVVGDWIQFTLPNVAAGTYDVAMLYKSNTNRAIVQASIDGVNQGPSCDQYASTPAFQVRCGLGTATLASGTHVIRFTATGKRSSSTSYLEVIDQISLTVSGGGSGAGGSGTGGSGTGGAGTGGSGGAGGSGGTAGGTSAAYEAEVLTRAASAAGSKVTAESGASAGSYVQFTSSTPAVGDWMEFTLPNVAAGTYDVALLYKSNTNRAIVQASIDGVNQGASCDQYASTPAFQVRCSLGTATLSAGNHVIRFTVIGKSSSSTSYLEVIDQISLTVPGSSGVPLDPTLLSRCTGSNPIKCTIPVPANGNYNVTVELGKAQAASSSQIEAELSRIVVPTVNLAAGTFSQHTFSVNVRTEVHDDYSAPGKQLDILINGSAPALHGLGYAAANIPTLFVVGDSTVCDWDPLHAGLGPTERGWAQEFSIYMKPGLAVANYADSGDTAGTLYTKFASRGAVLKKGDYLFIQFGHNDMKSTTDIANYKTNLMKFITDARNAQATPILFSPVARRAYLDDPTRPTTVADPGFNGLDQQARDLAAAQNVAFVDLTTLAINYYGTVDAPALFTSRTEIAHFNIVGATAISKLVADALKAGTTPATAIADFLK